ncbi:SPOR domain-containing protein [Spirochaeta cellobiosiphila]|uniref:SPOR domain-containing protein n=1 Tax=Spirochaeta cellobiosiphila TaxID=504483 RepID=UPI0004150FDA|nr:SPOR domain-containing protein [Spirochaeta cellobiosiphila]
MDQNNKPLIIFISAITALILLAAVAAFWYYPQVKDSDQAIFASAPAPEEITTQDDVMEWVRNPETIPSEENFEQKPESEESKDLVITYDVKEEGNKDKVIEPIVPDEIKQVQPAAVQKTAPVQNTPKPKVEPKPAPQQTIRVTEHWIQVASYTDRYRADETKKTLEENDVPVTVFTKTSGDKTYFRVRIGPYSNSAEAEKYLDWVKGLEGFGESYVTKVYVEKTLN